MNMLFQKGAIAVITGGASGIGRALAERCCEVGMRVIVGDQNSKALKALEDRWPGRLKTLEMDVGQPEGWACLKDMIENLQSGDVSLLVLNAGAKPESSNDNLSSFRKTFHTNVDGVVAGLECLLPSIQANAARGRRSAIVITGSKQGITNPPGYPAYNASKAAVKVIAEQLHFDSRNIENLSVHLLVPGWTHTGMNGRQDGDDNSTKPQGAWWPEQVVEYLEKSMKECHFWVLCPDNEVTEGLDKKRMQWMLGDALEQRPPLSRWRSEWKVAAEEFCN